MNKTEISAFLETYPRESRDKISKHIKQLHSEACYKVIDVMHRPG